MKNRQAHTVSWPNKERIHTHTHTHTHTHSHVSIRKGYTF